MTGAVSVLRPDLDQEVAQLPLYVSGTLPNATPGQAYRGELLIHNQAGACQVTSVTGSDLPAGGSIFCEGDKLVVAWPAFSASPIELQNPGFEDGSIDGWTLVKRGEVAGKLATGMADPGRPYAGTYSARWVGNKGNGHAGGVEALWVNNARGAAYPGQRVNGSVHIALDDTESSQNRGRAVLVFFDQAGNMIGDPFASSYPFKGTLIRGRDRAYKLSSVEAITPDGAASVAMAAWTTANDSANSGVRFDEAVWDAPRFTGINIETTLCFTIQIRDSTGRSALWAGCVLVQVIQRHVLISHPSVIPCGWVGISEQGTGVDAEYDIGFTADWAFRVAKDKAFAQDAAGNMYCMLDPYTGTKQVCAGIPVAPAWSRSWNMSYDDVRGRYLMLLQNVVYWSLDGINWTGTTQAWTGQLHGFLCVDGVMIVGGNNSVAFYSVDGGASWVYCGFIAPDPPDPGNPYIGDINWVYPLGAGWKGMGTSGNAGWNRAGPGTYDRWEGMPPLFPGNGGNVYMGFAPDGSVLALGGGGVTKRSTDRGVTWVAGPTIAAVNATFCQYLAHNGKYWVVGTESGVFYGDGIGPWTVIPETAGLGARPHYVNMIDI